MTTKIFSISLLVAIVLVALGAGAWYLLAPPKETPAVTDGHIEGTTAYPSDFNPEQTVCAQSLDTASLLRCVDVPEQIGATPPSFSIKVPPGNYQVYAFLKNPSDLGLTSSPKAYWSAFVECGSEVGCSSHERLTVTVDSGATVLDVRPQDWYVQ